MTHPVAPGDYEVQVSHAGRYNLAARILFRPDAEAVTYKPAVRVEEGGDYHVGVDSGAVSIFDAAAFVQLTYQEERRLADAMIEQTTGRPFTDEVIDRKLAEIPHEPGSKAVMREMLSRLRHPPEKPPMLRIRSQPPNPPDWIELRSGHGDGSYPCYWGLDADGQIVSLIVDFLAVGQIQADERRP